MRVVDDLRGALFYLLTGLTDWPAACGENLNNRARAHSVSLWN